MSERMFNEQKLQEEIERIWGPHGAHAYLYRCLLDENERLRELVASANSATGSHTVMWQQAARAALNQDQPE
jgi:hypothetical protein